jgi:hypothetical protein
MVHIKYVFSYYTLTKGNGIKEQSSGSAEHLKHRICVTMIKTTIYKPSAVRWESHLRHAHCAWGPPFQIYITIDHVELHIHYYRIFDLV